MRTFVSRLEGVEQWVKRVELRTKGEEPRTKGEEPRVKRMEPWGMPLTLSFERAALTVKRVELKQRGGEPQGHALHRELQGRGAMG